MVRACEFHCGHGDGVRVCGVDAVVAKTQQLRVCQYSLSFECYHTLIEFDNAQIGV